MKKRMILFGALTLMGTGAAFAFTGASAKKTADKTFCEESCPPECCLPSAKTTPACCYDPTCCE